MAKRKRSTAFGGGPAHPAPLPGIDFRPGGAFRFVARKGEKTWFPLLAVGQHFRKSDGPYPYGPVLKKVSDRCYVVPGKRNVPVKRRGYLTGKPHTVYVARMRLNKVCFQRKHLANTAVIPVGRTSMPKKRKGRGRGAAVFAGRR